MRFAPGREQRGPALGSVALRWARAAHPFPCRARATSLSLSRHLLRRPWRCRRAHKLRQVRPFHGPEETLRAPATGLQDIGFLAHEAKAEKRRVKNHCAETKFKSELIKAGIYV